jgi:hypothetical protein
VTTRFGAPIPPSGENVADNGVVPIRTALVRWATAVTVVTFGLAPAGCGAGHPPVIDSTVQPSAVPTTPTDAADQLAGVAAAAHDRRYAATYTLASHGRSDRTVLVTLATDGSWVVDVPGGALGGGADVAMVGLADGTYQCLLGGPATTVAATLPPAVAPSPSVSPTGSGRYAAPACVKLAAAGGTIPGRYDPIFEHVFTDWIGVMLDHSAPISVFTASALPHSTGSCYSVDPSSASLAPPIAAGIYCFTPDGVLTAVALTAGTLTLTGAPVAAPPRTSLPGPVVPGPPAPTKKP